MENFPSIINTESSFSFLVRGVAYTTEESYTLKLPLDSTTTTIYTTLIVADYTSLARDTTLLKVLNSVDSTLASFHLNGNKIYQAATPVTMEQTPHRVLFKSDNYSGKVNFILSRN